MRRIPSYPGTAQHQALLKCIVDYYQADPRVLAVIVFGSLGRGNWDAYSDLDLDIIVTDDTGIAVPAELRKLCAAFTPLNERAALIVPDGEEEGDIVLESLAQLSIRYHPLATTKPAILDTMRVLSGSLDYSTIAAAGNANRSSEQQPISALLDRCVRYAAVANVAFQRKQIWSAIEILHRMRALLMDIFARTHGSYRWYQFFDAQADQRLQQRFGETLPGYDQSSVQKAIQAMLDILEHDLPDLSNGQMDLPQPQRLILKRVRQAVESGSAEV